MKRKNLKIETKILMERYVRNKTSSKFRMNVLQDHKYGQKDVHVLVTGKQHRFVLIL